MPFDAREALSVSEAAAVAGRSDDTIRRWAALHDLGRIVGKRWIVSRIALAMFLDGERTALAAFLSGDRQSDLVMPYMRLLLTSAVRTFSKSAEDENKFAANAADAANAARGPMPREQSIAELLHDRLRKAHG